MQSLKKNCSPSLFFKECAHVHFAMMGHNLSAHTTIWKPLRHYTTALMGVNLFTLGAFQIVCSELFHLKFRQKSFRFFAQSGWDCISTSAHTENAKWMREGWEMAKGGSSNACLGIALPETLYFPITPQWMRICICIFPSHHKNAKIVKIKEKFK